MSRLSLTEQQKTAAHRGRGDTCVLAGAGTGKTTVLTARFLHLVEAESVSPRAIAALTFTDRAANEMRARIASAFAAASSASLRALAQDIEFSPISTFHSFCARMLRENAVAAGVDPAFEVLDEIAARLLLEDAWTSVERRLRREGDPRLRVLSLVGESDGWQTMLSLYVRARGLGVHLADLHCTRDAVPVADAVADVARALEAYDAAIADADLAGEKALDAERKRARFPTLDLLASGGPAAARAVARIASLRVSDAFAARVAVPARKELIDAWTSAADAALDAWAATEVEGPVRELLVAIDGAYSGRKAERGALDYDDLERSALALLDRLDAKGRSLPGRPARLLVDEYQDVNPVQARLLHRLRSAASGSRVDQFSVGDPKQSIYRFRRADVTVMQGEWAAVGPLGQTRLNESFRSRPEVVSFCNALFDRLFAGGVEGPGGVDPEPLTPAAEFHPSPVEPPEFLVVDAGAGTGIDRRLAEARAVARRIRAWIDGGALRTKKERRQDGDGSPAESRPRPLRFGDIAVLTRTRTHLKVYERALVEAGVPFHVGRGRGFFRAPEIEDLLHLLRVVHDPADRFAVASWMASPSVGATDEDLLAAFGDAAPEGEAGGSTTGKSSRGTPTSTDSADAFERASRLPRVAAAAERVRALRRLAASGSLEETVRAAVDGFDAIAIALLQPGGERRARNLEKAVSIARRLDDEGGHGLFDYLRALLDLQQREVEEAEAAVGTEGDSVALLTVHAAKGLEWPCVVVADTSRRDEGPTQSFHVTPEGEVGWRLRDPLEGTTYPTGGHRALERAERVAQSKESLRLLYVALTRAEERLLVTASVAGATDRGAPARIAGWAKRLWEALGAPFQPGTHDVHLGGAPARVSVEVATDEAPPATTSAPWIRRYGAAGVLTAPVEIDAATRAKAEALRLRVAEPVVTLARTPFIASISEILAFARSPAAYYEERLVGSDDLALSPMGPGLAPERDDPASGAEAGPDTATARAERAARWDEGRDVAAGVDRAALGRAVHLAIERWDPSSRSDLDALVASALEEEMPGRRPPEATPLARAMLSRFLESATGQAVSDALRRGAAGGVRREVAFHARIRFPDGQPVAGFDSLLVKGSIDLWMAGPGGSLTLFDHKTNAPGARFPDAATLVAHYETQLRLYALAAERLHDREVGGATLLLLDPAWAALGAPVETPVDVSGAALARTRSLCAAFATALLEGRFPTRWEDLLG